MAFCARLSGVDPATPAVRLVLDMLATPADYARELIVDE